jgi:hypothetical protein
MSLIRSALCYAVEAGFITGAINIRITLPREKQKEMRVLSVNEQRAFEKLLCFDMDERKLGVFICIYTGLRVGEAYVKLKLKNRRKYFFDEEPKAALVNCKCGFSITPQQSRTPSSLFLYGRLGTHGLFQSERPQFPVA